MLCVARKMFRFPQNSQTDSGRTRYFLSLYMEYTQISYEVATELSCLCLRSSTMGKDDHSFIAAAELNSRTELNVGKSFEL